jgi:16S rRNA (adenine(1408)-N(1))-methyltransferase
VGAVETPPAELVGRADLVTVHFPWGSLLRGLLAADPRAATGLASLLRAEGVLQAVLSIEERDGLDELAAIVADRGRLEAAWSAHGLRLEVLRPGTGAEVAATASTWAKRLGAMPGRRAITRLVLRRSRSMVG